MKGLGLGQKTHALSVCVCAGPACAVVGSGICVLPSTSSPVCACVWVSVHLHVSAHACGRVDLRVCVSACAPILGRGEAREEDTLALAGPTQEQL